MTTSRRSDPALLWLLPVLFTLALFAARAASLPFWQAFNLDPDYYYLLNGLRLVEGLSPTDVSHPGTPVQLLVAMVLRLAHPFATTADLVNAVLSDPEGHLMAVTSVLYPLLAPALWLLGREVWRWGGVVWPALLAQSAPFLSGIVVKMALHPKPEPFMVICAALLAAIGFAAARAEGPRDRHAVWAGVVMGLGVACKLHFAALGVLPLLLFDRRRWAIYAAISALSFAVFFAPALGSLDIWLGWLHRLAMGAGAYGEGPQTVIDPGRYPHQVLRLFSARWFYTGAIALSVWMLLAYVRLRRRGLLERDRSARLLVGIVLAQLATQLLIAKQPAPHYMIPAMMLTGPTLAILWRMSARLVPARRHRWAWLAMTAVMAVAGVAGTVRQVRELAGWSRETASLPMSRFDSCAKVYFDAASAPSFALLRGDMNALGRYSPLLAPRFPTNEYTWFVADHTWWKQGLVQWGRPVALADILDRYPCTVFRGNQFGRFEQLTSAIHFDDKCMVGEEWVYTKGTTCRAP